MPTYCCKNKRRIGVREGGQMQKIQSFMIEVDGDAGGIVIGDERGFTFHASVQWAWPLNGKRYQAVEQVERELAAKRPAKAAH